MITTENKTEFKLSDEQFDDIVKRASEVAAELLAAKIEMAQKIHTELFIATKALYDKYPALKGKHKELGEVCNRLQTANPELDTDTLLERSAQEVLRAN